jgi:hypothetical protein
VRAVDGEQALRVISSSLVGNTQLKSVEIRFWTLDLAADCFDCDKLLCDVTSIDSISNSNHTFENISVVVRFAGHPFSTLAKQCFELNKNTDKAKITRDKILRFYFVGEFDVAPFSNMPVSVLPEVMSQKIEGSDKNSAVYRMLQCIPELCNVSERVSSHQSGNKRQKIVLDCDPLI